MRRVWAGGKVVFHEGWQETLRMDGRGAVCVERVLPGVVFRGDKVLVQVERGYSVKGEEEGGVVVEERRDLVFMREVEGTEGKEGKEGKEGQQ